MRHNKNSDLKNDADGTLKELDLGLRKVSRQNFSWIVTLPHTFVKNCLGSGMEVKVSMSTDGKLTLMPIRSTKEKEEPRQ